MLLKVCVIIMAAEVFSGANAADCDVLDSYLKPMQRCLGKDQVADYISYRCYPLGLHSGLCRETSREAEFLVIDTTCERPIPRCLQFRASDGAACPIEKPLEHGGQCRSLSWPCDPRDRRRKLEPDVFGRVVCKCSSLMGYLEWPADGTCYHEFLRGPCGAGEQLMRQPFPGNATCVSHGCPQGHPLALCFSFQ
jgi:hypothetical protein